MSNALILSRATVGIDAPLVEVETHLSNGLPKFTIVGLPETTVTESKERVRSALINSGFDFPNRRITINLAPGDLPKEGARFDLPIALSILVASKQIPEPKEAFEAAGELTLTGQLREVMGILPMAMKTAKAGHAIILPAKNATIASLVPDLTVYAPENLLQTISHLNHQCRLNPHPKTIIHDISTIENDLSEVIGQSHAKRGLIIAASGQHHMLMSGPPGTGKTMLASRLNSILPPLEEKQILEILSIQSLVQNSSPLSFTRPFRQPHHTASGVALVGGGATPKPGEISLAHHGVLFLDELPEFSRKVLEVLREPIESGKIHISRAKQQITYPSRFQLIAAMNPCPCGYLGDEQKSCHCSPDQISRYRNKLSGPFLDRIDIHVQVVRLKHTELFNEDKNQNGIDSKMAQSMAKSARNVQLKRQGKPNSLLSNHELKEYCKLNGPLKVWLAKTIEKLALSPRAYHKILKVSRTIADLNGQDQLSKDNLLEALSFRANQGQYPVMETRDFNECSNSIIEATYTQ